MILKLKQNLGIRCNNEGQECFYMYFYPRLAYCFYFLGHYRSSHLSSQHSDEKTRARAKAKFAKWRSHSST